MEERRLRPVGQEREKERDLVRRVEEAEEPEDEPEDEPAEPEEFAAGDHVEWETGTGTISRMNEAGTKALIVTAEKEKVWFAVDSLMKAEEEPAPKAKTKAAAPAPKVKADAKPKYKKGEEVSWMDGKKTKSGKVIAVDGTTLTVKHANGDKVEVEADDLIPFDGGDPEPEAKPAAKKGGKSGGTCPHKGGTFGKDVDKYGKECDACPQWEACEAASVAK